ncbi:MAG: hypothetical protein QMC80_09145 [Thermoplasmatales archaeon]|nr:hypothetical protein [Thermoplasmatales archaeon]
MSLQNSNENLSYFVNAQNETAQNQTNASSPWAELCCLVPVAMIAVRILGPIWIYVDADKRGKNGIVWAFFGFIFGFITLIIWLATRPKEKTLGYMPGAEYKPYQPAPSAPVCPYCKAQLTFMKEYQKWYCYNCRKYL